MGIEHAKNSLFGKKGSRWSPLDNTGDRKLMSEKGTKETGDAGVTYYGTKEDLASGAGPSEGTGSRDAYGRDVFATSAGVKTPSSLAFEEARGYERAQEAFDKANARQIKRETGKDVSNMNRRQRQEANERAAKQRTRRGGKFQY